MIQKPARCCLSFTLACLVIATSVFLSSCNGDGANPDPADSTANNTIDSAWNVDIPYNAEVTVSINDPQEVFYFGIGESQAFGYLIRVNVKLIDPLDEDFYINVELLSETEKVLVSGGRESDSFPAVWIATRPNQTYYLLLEPIGETTQDRYTYSVSITSAEINDPAEPDEDTSEATRLVFDQIHGNSYLSDPYSDSIESMLSLPDLYKLNVTEQAIVNISITNLGPDFQPMIRLYSTSGELVGQVEDSTLTLDLSTVANFQAGDWFIEITDSRGYFSNFGKGNPGFNHTEPYRLLVTKDLNKGGIYEF